MLLNCSVEEDSWESLGLQGDQTSQSYRKSILNIHYRDWCWSASTLAIWCEEPTHWKRSWCWERLQAGGDRDDRAWDSWMASPAQWTGVWASSLACCSSWGHRVGHDWATELNWVRTIIWPSPYKYRLEETMRDVSTEISAWALLIHEFQHACQCTKLDPQPGSHCAPDKQSARGRQDEKRPQTTLKHHLLW